MVSPDRPLVAVCLILSLVGLTPPAAAEPPTVTLRYEGLGTEDVAVYADLADGRSFAVPVSFFCRTSPREPLWPVCLFAFYGSLPIDGHWVQASGGGTFSRDGTAYDVVVTHTGTGTATGAAWCQGNTTCTVGQATWSPVCPAGLAAAYFFPAGVREEDGVVHYSVQATGTGMFDPCLDDPRP